MIASRSNALCATTKGRIARSKKLASFTYLLQAVESRVLSRRSFLYVELLIHRVFSRTDIKTFANLHFHSTHCHTFPWNFRLETTDQMERSSKSQACNEYRRSYSRFLWIYDNSSSLRFDFTKKKFFPCSYLTFRSQIFKYVPSEVFSSIRSCKLDQPFT